MLRVEDQIDNATVMIKTADFIEMQLHKLKSDGGPADEYAAIAGEALESLRACLEKNKIR